MWRWFHVQSSDFLCTWYYRWVTKCRGVGGIAPFSGSSCFISFHTPQNGPINSLRSNLIPSQDVN